MPRITISIPAGLKQRLEDPRVRKSINVSRVCQEALSREIHRMLDLPLDLARMQRVLKRLIRQREQVRDRWFSEGSITARDWVEHEAPYAFLRQLGEASPSSRIHLLAQSPPRVLADRLMQLKKVKDFSQRSFMEGFSQTIGFLWEVIEKSL